MRCGLAEVQCAGTRERPGQALPARASARIQAFTALVDRIPGEPWAKTPRMQERPVISWIKPRILTHRNSVFPYGGAPIEIFPAFVC